MWLTELSLILFLEMSNVLSEAHLNSLNCSQIFCIMKSNNKVFDLIFFWQDFMAGACARDFAANIQ